MTMTFLATTGRRNMLIKPAFERRVKKYHFPQLSLCKEIPRQEERERVELESTKVLSLEIPIERQDAPPSGKKAYTSMSSAGHSLHIHY